MRAADIPVLGLEEGGGEGEALIRAEIEAAVHKDGAEAIVLGCAGMAALAKRLSVDFGLPVIDGVAAAVKQVEGLVAQGLKTSKIGGYAMPPRKNYVVAKIGEFTGNFLIIERGLRISAIRYM